MTGLIQPICYPQPYDDESPVGYLIRVCEANKFNSVRWLYSADAAPFSLNPLDILSRLLESPWSGFEKIESNIRTICKLKRKHLNYTVLRYCPECLEEEPYYRAQWYIKSTVACVKHRCWLIDRCIECGDELSYSRKALITECHCGASLLASPTSEITDYVLRYQQFVDGVKEFVRGHEFWLASSLNPLSFNLDARIQLAQAFAQWQPVEASFSSKSGQFSGLSNIETARPYVLLLSDAYFSDLDGFSPFLESIHQQVYPDQLDGDKLFKRFYKFFFHQIGTRIDPLYKALENYVHHNWQYSLSQKNSLFSEAMIEYHPWIPLQAASKRFDLGKVELESAVSMGMVSALYREYPKSGRTFTLVYIPDILKYLHTYCEQVDAVTAASILGVTKKQFNQLLEHNFIEGIPPSKESGATWRFDRKVLNSMLKRFTDHIPVVDDQYISLPDAIRKIGNRIRNPMINLLQAIDAGEVHTKKNLIFVGLRSLCISEEQLQDWYDAQVNDKGVYSVVSLAKEIHVKPALVSQLIEKGLLRSFSIKSRKGRLISIQSVNEFKDRYVLLQKLGYKCPFSYPSLKRLLLAEGVETVDKELPPDEQLMCRVYYRHDLIKVKEVSSVVGAMFDWDCIN